MQARCKLPALIDNIMSIDDKTDIDARHLLQKKGLLERAINSAPTFPSPMARLGVVLQSLAEMNVGADGGGDGSWYCEQAFQRSCEAIKLAANWGAIRRRGDSVDDSPPSSSFGAEDAEPLGDNVYEEGNEGVYQVAGITRSRESSSAETTDNYYAKYDEFYDECGIQEETADMPQGEPSGEKMPVHSLYALLEPTEDVESFLRDELGLKEGARDDRETCGMALNTLGRIFLYRSRIEHRGMDCENSDNDDNDECNDDNEHTSKLLRLSQSCICFRESSALSGFGKEIIAGDDNVADESNAEDLEIKDDDDLATVERKLLQMHAKKKFNRRTSHQNSLLSRSSNWVIYGALAHAKALLLRGYYLKDAQNLAQTTNLMTAVLSFINVQCQISDTINFTYVKQTAHGIIRSAEAAQANLQNNRLSVNITPTGKLTTMGANNDGLLLATSMIYENEMFVVGVFRSGVVRRWTYDKSASSFVFKRSQTITSNEITHSTHCDRCGLIAFVSNAEVRSSSERAKLKLKLKPSAYRALRELTFCGHSLIASNQ